MDPSKQKVLETVTSPEAFLFSTQPAADSLDDQLDRLTQVIQTMVDGRRHIEGSQCSGVSSFLPRESSSIDFDFDARLSVYPNRPSISDEDELFKKLETTILENDRLHMALEDFRASEFRKEGRYADLLHQEVTESLVKALGDALDLTLANYSLDAAIAAVRARSTQRVECGLHELAQLRSDVAKVLSASEQDLCHEGQLTLGAFQVHVVINSNKPHFPPKQVVSSLFASKNATPKALDTAMKTEAQEVLAPVYNLESSQNWQSDPMPTNPRVIHRARTEYEFLKDTLEWERSEVSMLSSNMRDKEAEVARLKTFLEKQSELIKQRNVQLEKDREAFEQQLEEFQQLKNGEEQVHSISRLKVEHIKAELLSLLPTRPKATVQGFSRPATTATASFEEDPVIQSLRLKINEFEERLPEVTQEEREGLQVKLTHLQTRLSSLRAQLAISSSVSANNLVKSIISRVEQTWDHKSQTSSHTGVLNAEHLLTPKYYKKAQPFLSPRTEVKPPARLNPTKDISCTTKELSRIKARVEAQQDELHELETYLKDNWMSAPSADELLPLVQQDTRRLQEATVHLQKQRDLLDEERIALAKRQDELNIKESEVQTGLAELVSERTALGQLKDQLEANLTNLVQSLN